MTGRLFFLGGVHGVGKGTLCKRLSTAASIASITASDLIRTHRASDDGRKRVEHVGANQSALLLALASYRSTLATDLILDGHFVLFDSRGNVEDIADEVFAEMAPASLLLLTDEVTSIHAKLLRRDGTAPELGALAEMAEREKVKAESLSENLNLPLKSFAPDVAIDELLDFLRIQKGAAS